MLSPFKGFPIEITDDLFILSSSLFLKSISLFNLNFCEFFVKNNISLKPFSGTLPLKTKIPSLLIEKRWFIEDTKTIFSNIIFMSQIAL